MRILAFGLDSQRRPDQTRYVDYMSIDAIELGCSPHCAITDSYKIVPARGALRQGARIPLECDISQSALPIKATR